MGKNQAMLCLIECGNIKVEEKPKRITSSEFDGERAREKKHHTEHILLEIDQVFAVGCLLNCP